MRPAITLDKVFVYREPVDMRKQINGLAVLVESALEMDPFSAQLFVFCNRRRDIVKILGYEGNGFVLWQKRLEQERFKWPQHLGDHVITLSGQQLHWLLDGYDLKLMRGHQSRRYATTL